MTAYLAVGRVAVACLLLWLVFTGIGLLLRRLFARTPLAPAELFLLPWVGWGASIAFLQLWHMTRAVDAAAAVAVAAAGLAGLALHSPELARLLSAHRRRAWWMIAVACGLALWLANNSVRQPGVYDAGLYHLNTIHWNRAYAVVPGLGNLHGRFAFNNASFLYAALLEVGPFDHRSHHLASAFLIWLVFLPCAHGLWTVLRRPQAVPVPQVFLALLAVPILAWSLNSGYVPSASPDVPIFLLTIVLTALLLVWLDPQQRPPPRLAALAAIFLLAMVGVAVKLTAAVFGAVAALIALILYGRRQASPRAWFAALVLSVALAVFVLAPWCMRGVTLSGYPVFPVTIGRCPVDWAMPRGAVEGWVEVLQSYARDHDAPREAVLNTWTWVGPWFRRTLHDSVFDFTMPFALLATALAMVAALNRQRPGAWRDWRWVALLPAVVGEIAWFFSSPDPRYQAAMPWVLVAGTLAIGGRNWARRRTLVLALSVLVGVMFIRPLDLVLSWKDPGPAQQMPLNTRTTDAGLQVYVPVQGDQCWDSDLPATPYFKRRLRLRVPGDMSKGFTSQPIPTETANQPVLAP